MIVDTADNKKERHKPVTTNDSGKLNMGGVSAIKGITDQPYAEWTTRQRETLAACLDALAHQPTRWYSYQEWGAGGPVQYLAAKGIVFTPTPDRTPKGKRYYRGCGCGTQHWRIVPNDEPSTQGRG